MKIQYVSCPRCGGELQSADLNRIHFCSFCGAPLYVDDGVIRMERTTIIRDEARIKEAEIRARRLELEEQRKGTEKTIEILFIAVIGMVYLVSPVDLMSGMGIDDFIVCYICLKAISKRRRLL